MVTVIVDINQSIWDLAIQYYGTPDMVKQLILDNPTKINFQDNITPGRKILINEDLVVDQQLVDNMKKTGIIPCSGFYDSVLGYDRGDFNDDFSNDFNN